VCVCVFGGVLTAISDDRLQDNTDGFKLLVVCIKGFEIQLFITAISLQENDRMIRLSDHLIQKEKISLHYANDILSETTVVFAPSAAFVTKLCPCESLHPPALQANTNTLCLLWPTLSTSRMDLVLHAPPLVLSRPF